MTIDEIISLLYPGNSESLDTERRDYDRAFLENEENMKMFSKWLESSYNHPETAELSPEERVKMMLGLTKRDVYVRRLYPNYEDSFNKDFRNLYQSENFILENLDDIDRNLIEFGKTENNLGLNQNEIMAFAVNRVKLNPEYVTTRKKRDLLKYKKQELAILEAEVKEAEQALNQEQTIDPGEE